MDEVWLQANLADVGLVVVAQMTVACSTKVLPVKVPVTFLNLPVTNTGSGPSFVVEDATSPDTTPFIIDASGNVGIGTTTPWRKFTVTGTVGFDGLTGSTGAGSLCLDSNKQVVYNSASDNCLSSTRATKHDILDLDVGSLSLVDQLQPVSFVYNEGDGRVRYGFIAEDTAAVDEHLVTYDASSTVSGIDDRSIIAILVGAIKDLYARTQEYFARTERLEERVSALEAQLSSSAAAGAPSVGNTNEAPNDRPASGGSPDTDTATSTTPSALETSVANDNEPVVADDAPNATERQADVSDQEPADPEEQSTEQPELEPANDNSPVEPLSATGTE